VTSTGQYAAVYKLLPVILVGTKLLPVILVGTKLLPVMLVGTKLLPVMLVGTKLLPVMLVGSKPPLAMTACPAPIVVKTSRGANNLCARILFIDYSLGIRSLL
jgi:hypothetical protein